jgi:hypothetical protein
MEYQNGQFLSAYTKNDTLFEGNVYTRLDGTKVVLNEDKKWLPISELKEIRLIQEANDDDQDIQKLVDADIGKCDIDKLSSLDDGTLGKVGDNRENELIKSGIKISKGDYSTKFTNSVKANSLAKDANAGNISISTALEKYKQSKDVDIDMRIKNTLKESFEDDDLLDDDFGVADYEDNFSEDETDTFDEFDDEDFSDFSDIYDEDVDDVIVDKQEDDLLYDDAFENFDESKIREEVDKEFEAAFDEFEESVVRYDTSKLYEFICDKFGYEAEKDVSNFEEAVFNLEEAEVKNRIKEFKFQQGRYHGDDRDLAGLYYITKDGAQYGNKVFNPTEAKEKLNYLRETYPEFTWGVQKTN